MFGRRRAPRSRSARFSPSPPTLPLWSRAAAAGVNLSAFESRLAIACSSNPRSNHRRRPRAPRRRTRRRAAAREGRTAPPPRAASSPEVRTRPRAASCRRPRAAPVEQAGSPARARGSSCAAPSRVVSRGRRAPRRKLPSRSSSGPIVSVSGVRNSCDVREEARLRGVGLAQFRGCAPRLRATARARARPVRAAASGIAAYAPPISASSAASLNASVSEPARLISTRSRWEETTVHRSRPRPRTQVAARRPSVKHASRRSPARSMVAVAAQPVAEPHLLRREELARVRRSRSRAATARCAPRRRASARARRARRRPSTITARRVVSFGTGAYRPPPRRPGWRTTTCRRRAWQRGRLRGAVALAARHALRFAERADRDRTVFAARERVELLARHAADAAVRAHPGDASRR